MRKLGKAKRAILDVFMVARQWSRQRKPAEPLMPATIYQRPKNAMQSGRALTDQWLLDFEPAEARRADPLMGWAGSGDTQAQVQLKFDTLDAAKAYANKNGIAYHVIAPAVKILKIQTYADNFR
jgi:hypothetical protein